MSRTRTLLIGFVAAMQILAAGCRSAPRKVEQMPGVAVRSSAVQQPAIRGVEMYWWGFDDGGDPAALARKLRPYLANLAPTTQSVQRDWRLNGLRMVVVPVQLVSALEEDMHVSGVQRKVLGEVTNWTMLASGPAWTGQLRLQMQEGELALDSGRLRLIGRAWNAPQIIEGRDGAAGEVRFVSRIELAMQHEERDKPGRDALVIQPAATGPHSIKDEGLILSRTIAHFDLAADQAVLIFPEPPESDLIELAASRPEPEAANADAGPVAPRTPTAGELMLAGTVLGKAPARRAIIVLTHVTPPKVQ